MKKAISALLTLCLLIMTFAPCALAGENTLTLSNAPDVARYILDGPGSELTLAPGTLVSEEGEREVWFVTLMGIDWSMRGVNNIFSFLLVSVNAGNRYFDAAKSAILQHVPAGAALVLAGHSLGGMIVQQLICDGELTSRYEVYNALTFGSPYVVVDTAKREGALIRLEDRYDTIPKFSLACVTSPYHYNGGIKRDGGYLGDPNGAHNFSYRNAEVWGAFDALGDENGGARLTLDLGALIAYNV